MEGQDRPHESHMFTYEHVPHVWPASDLDYGVILSTAGV